MGARVIQRLHGTGIGDGDHLPAAVEDEIENVLELNRGFVLEVRTHAEREEGTIQRCHRRIEDHLHLRHLGQGLAVPEQATIVEVRHLHVFDQLPHISHHGIEVEQGVLR